ncbi:MAG: acyl-CoA dehydrogenase [Betaproteobacteria bacterium]|nr:acyl-CoA dehydrogenase [Betaproteobacteria bacterium]
MTIALVLIVAVIGVMTLAYARAQGALWLVSAMAFLVALKFSLGASWALIGPVIVIGTLAGLFLVIQPLRQRLVSDRLLAIFRRIMPAMSQTEAEAIHAGTIWWDGELFTGRPDWDKMLAYPKPSLTSEKRAFVEEETAQLCAMVSEWETTHHNYDMPPQVWQFIKDKSFLGMIIPKSYDGKGFSAYAHSEVIQRLSTRSSAAAVSVMVPNSLGPAELLLHYGTDEQKNFYLPRLAKGIDTPCFSLTNPHAGSDAAAIPDVGIVCKGPWQGKEVLGMRVTWEKRYITLGPISTILGLTFQLKDPLHLLGDVVDIGITCALVPSDTPGVNIGRRHMTLNAGFMNGPNWGKDVFMPLDWIIGGPKMAGQGWRMLMECLAAGRSISLPSSSVGLAKLAVLGTGAYARIRTQFNTSVGKFEGVEEALARMGGNLYMMDAVRRMTVVAVDAGEKPSVLSAIAKYHVTERARAIVNDAMDIQGGKGICLGPNNFMGRIYQQVPIAITLEGANILTRSLIIFGQGAIRCHPYVLRELNAARDTDHTRASRHFDRAFWSHVKFILANAARTFVTGLTGSHFIHTPSNIAPETRRYYQQLTRFSAAFAFIADISMLVLGAGLKRRGKLSARLGDVLSLMYLVSCTLKRFEDDGRPAADAPLMHWAIWDAMFKTQTALEGVVSNYPSRIIAAMLRFLIYPTGRPYSVPSDQLGHDVARLLIAPSATRDRLTAGCYVPSGTNDIIGTMKIALAGAVEVEAIESRIKAARRDGRLGPADDLYRSAVAAGVITAEDVERIKSFHRLREEVIRVDHFAQDFGLSEALHPVSARAAA